jgi:hypothetical protein
MVFGEKGYAVTSPSEQSSPFQLVFQTQSKSDILAFSKSQISLSASERVGLDFGFVCFVIHNIKISSNVYL